MSMLTYIQCSLKKSNNNNKKGEFIKASHKSVERQKNKKSPKKLKTNGIVKQP